MGYGVEVNVVGFDELHRKLAQTDRKARKRAIVSGLRAAAKPMRAEARNNAPRDTGLLRQSIDTKIVTRTEHATGAVIIGPSKSVAGKMADRIRAKAGPRAANRQPANYAHLVEGGTVKGVRATRFLERAFKTTVGRSYRNMAAAVWATISAGGA